eukprot:CAMPEP_0206158572 /NCGR_PEP_ID=MMETSP1474-20131121/4972_1 /ASSEMBLY_ACC=CAM_ASM_001110 /TAXON_ID=97495 /ORGANISM="Imantonia sp., Strain RCC918" /LENGTH=705 /DNA_ID=CAMNT_0053558731 /DNA_START=29 /DNA_END=2146 /DNA_ORIENTATION=+
MAALTSRAATSQIPTAASAMKNEIAFIVSALLFASRADGAVLGSEKARALQELHKLVHASDNISVPRIVVVGAQNVGKSSLLNAMLKSVGSPARFPTGDGLVTMQPALLTMLEEDNYHVFVEGQNLTDCLTPTPTDNVDVDALPTKNCVKDAINARADEKRLNAGSTWTGKPLLGISAEELTLTAHSPQLKGAIMLVDLPGFNALPSVRYDIESMYSKYMQSPETIILSLVQCNTDNASDVSSQIAQQADMKGERTIRVWTKCMHAGDQDQVKSDCSGDGRFAGHAINLYKGMDENVKQCRPDRTGVDNLVERVSSLLKDAVKRASPGLSKQHMENTRAVDDELRVIGHEAPDHHKMTRSVMKELNNLLSKSRIQKFLSSDETTFDEEISNTSRFLTAQYVSERFQADHYEFPIFQGQSMFNAMMKDLTEKWAALAQQHITKMFHNLFGVLDSDSSEWEDTCTKLDARPPKAFCTAIKDQLLDNLTAWEYEIIRESVDTAMKSRGYNHHHVEDQVITWYSLELEKLSTRVVSVDPYSSMSDPEQVQDSWKTKFAQLLKIIDACKDLAENAAQTNGEWLKKFVSTGGDGTNYKLSEACKNTYEQIIDSGRRSRDFEDDQVKMRVLAASLSWWKFTRDNFLSAMKGLRRKHIIYPLRDWPQDLGFNAQLMEYAAREDPDVAERRMQLIATKARFEEITRAIRELGAS